MSSRNIVLTPALEAYLLDVAVQEPPVLGELRRETAQLPGAHMQIGPDQGRFMRWLVELTRAERCIEIGVFTGYSAISLALGLGDGGRLVGCDINPTTTEVAKRYFERAGVANKIRIELRPALETLEALLADGQAGLFDLAFVDADKESLDVYYEKCLQLLRVNGLLLIDNTLWSGRVAEPAATDPATLAIRAINLKIGSDPRVSATIVPIGDGLTLARKRQT